MDNIYKLLLVIAVLTIAVGCENKCDEDDFIGFKMTQDKFFYTTKILVTKVDNVSKVEKVVESEQAKIAAFGNSLIITPRRQSTRSASDADTPDTKFSPAWNYELFNMNSAYPPDYEIACELELCCYSCVGVEDMFFDESGQFKAKIDNSNINLWYVYYDNSWWQWNAEKAQIDWGTLNP